MAAATPWARGAKHLFATVYRHIRTGRSTSRACSRAWPLPAILGATAVAAAATCSPVKAETTVTRVLEPPVGDTHVYTPRSGSPGLHESVLDVFHAAERVMLQSLVKVEGTKKTARRWTTTETDRWGGHGTSHCVVIQGGTEYDRAGIMIQSATSRLTPDVARQLRHHGLGPLLVGLHPGSDVRLVTLSMVAQPRNPNVPDGRMVVRYMEQVGESTGRVSLLIELLPTYLFRDDVELFHETLRSACGKCNGLKYETAKAGCDKVQLNKLTGLWRGVGGIAIDSVPVATEEDLACLAGLTRAFRNGYSPTAQRRIRVPYGPTDTLWQLVRRGQATAVHKPKRKVPGGAAQDPSSSVLLRHVVASREMLEPSLALQVHTPDTAAWGHRASQMMEVLHQPRSWVSTPGGADWLARASLTELVEEVMRRKRDPYA